MSHVFISYSKKDKEYARKLADKLIELGFDVWIDDRIDYGEDWWREIVRAIRGAKAFIAIMSDESDASDWVQREVTLADKHKIPAFPLWLDGDFHASENWAIYVRTQYVDVRGGHLPSGGFYNRLEKNAPRKNGRGIELDIRAKLPTANVNISSDLQATHIKALKVELPPPPDLSGILPPPFEWCYVSAGKVTIEYNDTEKRTFDVSPFYISKYPITNAQFAKFIEANGYRISDYWTIVGWNTRNIEQWTEPRFWRDERFNDAKNPVVGVSWYEALAFNLWLNERARQVQEPHFQILLPTEHQWQRAAQGDEGWPYPWGDRFNKEWCNTIESSIGKTTSVTQYPHGVSPFGVMDMSGNVWDWCLTKFDEDNELLEGVMPRIAKGGSWHFNQLFARTTYREWNNPFARFHNYGFRVVHNI